MAIVPADEADDVDFAVYDPEDEPMWSDDEDDEIDDVMDMDLWCDEEDF